MLGLTPNLHPTQKNTLLQTQICPHPNVLTPLLRHTATAIHAVPREIADVTLKEPTKPPRPGPPDTSNDRIYRDLERLIILSCLTFFMIVFLYIIYLCELVRMTLMRSLPR